MIAQQHRAYQTWLKELNFYEDELLVFQKELNLLVERHSDLLSIVEHVKEYQLIFEKKKKNLKSLQDELLEKEHQLNLVLFDPENQKREFELMENKHRRFVKAIELLKKNFRRFVSKNI